MRRGYVSTLVWSLVCVFVFCTFLPGLLLERHIRINEDRDPYRVLAGEWEIGLGWDQPAASDWKPLIAEVKEQLKEYEGTVWLQRRLPELKWNNPYLFFTLMNQFEVFLNGDSVYSFNQANDWKHINAVKLIHPVQIHPQDTGKMLQIRMTWEAHLLLASELVTIGEPDQMLFALIQTELAFLILGLLSLTIGIAVMVMFIRRKVTLYGWFALFCLSLGLSFLLSCRSLQWFIEVERLYYWNELLIPVAIWACIGFYTSALNAGRRLILLALHLMMGVYCLASIYAAIMLPAFFLEAGYLGNAIVAVAVFVIVAFAIVYYKLWKLRAEEGIPSTVGHEEWMWLMRGNATFTLCATASLVFYTLPDLLTEWSNSQVYLYHIIAGLLPNALFLFIICMGMVIVSRVRRIHQQAERSAVELLVKNKELEQFHRNLEQLVHTRTAELEHANRNLAVTLRDKAETLAEKSVLEERNRIAYEMHDVVGHTLTAAIVQIEATKTLAERDGGLALERMDLLSELVRKGLDDIRKAVRMMKADDEPPSLSLEASLRELIQYTEDTMDIVIEAEIALPPDLVLGTLTERVLYHALQEGLTNGIRHGKCTCARFVIRVVDHTLHFELISDGEPFGTAVPGFGLSSMMERIELLGGEVHIRSSADQEDRPMGCELSIRLPLG